MKILTKKNLAEAKLDLQKLTDPTWGGYNLLYNDNYFGAGLREKWGDLGVLDKNIKAMEAELASVSGAGI